MPSVAEMSAPYANFMRAPRAGAGVCRTCFNLTDDYDRCYACAHGGDSIDVVDPISYSVAGEQLHYALSAYKRSSEPWTRSLTVGLAAVLWRHLDGHQRCLAHRLGIEGFPLVTTVPSGDPARPHPHPLQTIVSQLVGPTRERHEALLARTDVPLALHAFSPDRFVARRRLGGEPVLIVDDTWTTGANAQSAAATLKRAGSGPVAVVVIGRFLNRDWGDNDRRLGSLPAPFDWRCCPYCAAPASASAAA